MKKITLNTEQICKSQGIKQTGFIRLMDQHGISRNTAIKVFHGEANVLLHVVIVAVKVLGVSLDDIVQLP